MKSIQGMAARLALLLPLLTSAPAQADAVLKEGDIVTIKNAVSGLYLSASDRNDELKLSPNASAWEQWQYVKTSSGYNPQFVSYHGTVLSEETHSGTRILHRPLFIGAGDSADPSDWAIARWVGPSGEYAKNGDASAVLDATNAILFSTNNNSQIRRVLSQNAANAPTLETQRYDGSEAKPYNAWIFTKVAAPAAGRKPMKLSATADIRSGYSLMHFSGKYLGRPVFAKGTYPYMYAPAPPTLAAANTGWTVDDVTRNGTAMQFGDVLNIYFMGSSGNNMMLQLATDPAYAFLGANVDKSTTRGWTVVDPMGIYQPGSRVPVNTAICLRSSANTFLSADPGQTQIKLSPNCNPSATWEQWAFNAPPQ